MLKMRLRPPEGSVDTPVLEGEVAALTEDHSHEIAQKQNDIENAQALQKEIKNLEETLGNEIDARLDTLEPGLRRIYYGMRALNKKSYTNTLTLDDLTLRATPFSLTLTQSEIRHDRNGITITYSRFEREKVHAHYTPPIYRKSLDIDMSRFGQSLMVYAGTGMALGLFGAMGVGTFLSVKDILPEISTYILTHLQLTTAGGAMAGATAAVGEHIVKPIFDYLKEKINYKRFERESQKMFPGECLGTDVRELSPKDAIPLLAQVDEVVAQSAAGLRDTAYNNTKNRLYTGQTVVAPDLDSLRARRDELKSFLPKGPAGA